MTEPRHIPAHRKHPYSRFALAVATYVIGVAAFSTWSFFEQSAGTTPGAAPGMPNRIALMEGAEALFLLIMAVPLITLYHRARVRSTHEVEALNAQLQNDYQKLQKREAQLEEAIHDLERFNALATGREERIVELKGEVNALLADMNQPQRYDTATGKQV